MFLYIVVKGRLNITLTVCLSVCTILQKVVDGLREIFNDMYNEKSVTMSFDLVGSNRELFSLVVVLCSIL